MVQRIEFKSSDNAKSVSNHLYNVQLERNCLVFSEFDEEAFGLAVALEGLDESAYDVLYDFQTTQTLSNYGAAIRHPTRFYDPPKYVVKIKLLESFPCFNLTAIAAPIFYGNSNKLEEVLINLVIDDVFAWFMSVLLTQRSEANSIILSGRIDKAGFTAKNVGTKDVQHFLTISCDNQLQTMQLYPVNNVTIERVSIDPDC